MEITLNATVEEMAALVRQIQARPTPKEVIAEALSQEIQNWHHQGEALISDAERLLKGPKSHSEQGE